MTELCSLILVWTAWTVILGHDRAVQFDTVGTALSVILSHHRAVQCDTSVNSLDRRFGSSQSCAVWYQYEQPWSSFWVTELCSLIPAWTALTVILGHDRAVQFDTSVNSLDRHFGSWQSCAVWYSLNSLDCHFGSQSCAVWYSQNSLDCHSGSWQSCAVWYSQNSLDCHFGSWQSCAVWYQCEQPWLSFWVTELCSLIPVWTALTVSLGHRAAAEWNLSPSKSQTVFVFCICLLFCFCSFHDDMWYAVWTCFQMRLIFFIRERVYIFYPMKMGQHLYFCQQYIPLPPPPQPTHTHTQPPSVCVCVCVLCFLYLWDFRLFVEIIPLSELIP